MKRPRKAVLLAAGLGTRMRPLTDDMPKAMLPFWGKPIVGHVIDLVRGWGVREILVNAHHAPDPLIRYLRNRPKDGVMINISFESDLLGTGGALKRAAWFTDDEPFWIVNTDVAMDVSPLPFLAEFREKSPIAVLWLDARTGPRTVEMDRRRITSFRSCSPGSAGTYTFCGLQMVAPALFRFFPKSNAFSLVEVYENAMAAGEAVRGIVVPRSFWSDLGAPERYRKAHGDVIRRFRTRLPGGRLLNHSQYGTLKSLRHRGIRVSGYACVGNRATIGRGAQIRESVIWDGAKVEPRCRLNNAIIAGGAVVSGHVEGVAVPCVAKNGQNELIGMVLRRIGWKAEETTVILPGARGSDRSFTRLQRGGSSVMVIQYGTARSENTRYASHARFLRSEGVPVPRVLADMPQKRTTVMEYLGGPSLEALAGALSATTLEDRYKTVLDSLLIMHRIPSRRITAGRIVLEPKFSVDVYSWERELMARHFLRGRLHLSERTIRAVMVELESVADRLAEAPQVLVHRDLQSSNILWHGRRPIFIDFQGMRLGPAVYDLASLLCDPYVLLPFQTQSCLLEYYARRTGQTEQLTDLFWFAAVQRLAQALGAFGRLSAVPETSSFAHHIRPGLVMMNRALGRLDELGNTRALVQVLLLAGSV